MVVMSMKKLFMVILVLALVGSAFAIASNWHKLAEIVGVIKPPSSGLIPVRIDLGTLQPAQTFTFYANTTLTCNSEYNVTKLIVAIPSSASEWRAMIGGFKDLYLKVQIDVITLSLPDIPVVVGGSSAINPGTDSNYWRFEFQETPISYYSYKGGGTWSPQIWNPLKPGNHTVYIDVTGQTSIPAEQVNFSITLYLEMVPA